MVLEFIEENPIAVSQTLLSLALVVATVAYTYYTKSQTDEMEATRETSNQPVLKGGVLTPAPTLVSAEIKNTGNAAAHDVVAKVYFDDVDCEPAEYRIPILSPGDDYRFQLPIVDSNRGLRKMDRIEKKLDDEGSKGKLTFQFSCQNPFEVEYDYENQVDVREWLDNSTYTVNYEDTAKMHKSLKSIDSSIDSIDSTLESIEGNIEPRNPLQ